MFLDCRSFDGLGPTPPFCQEVLRECMARGFTGVVCDFESGRIPPLEQVVQELGNQCFRRSPVRLSSYWQIPLSRALLLTPASREKLCLHFHKLLVSDALRSRTCTCPTMALF